MRIAFAVAALAAAVAPARSEGQLSLGARAGYARGVGDVGGTLAMGDWLQGQIPVQVDVLYGVRPRLALGGYVSYGFAQAGGDAADACEREADGCSASVVRVGAQALWSLPPVRRVTPWLGFGLGYEWTRLEGGAERSTFSGIELLNLAAGGELPLGERLRIGPFLSISVGQYGRGEVGDVDRPIPRKKAHAWVELGVSGRFGFGRRGGRSTSASATPADASGDL